MLALIGSYQTSAATQNYVSSDNDDIVTISGVSIGEQTFHYVVFKWDEELEDWVRIAEKISIKRYKLKLNKNFNYKILFVGNRFAKELYVNSYEQSDSKCKSRIMEQNNIYLDVDFRHQKGAVITLRNSTYSYVSIGKNYVG